MIEPAETRERLAWALGTLGGGEGGGGAGVVMLNGKRILVTGALDRESIAFHVAAEVQRRAPR